jgi:hypothetical protein
MTEETKATQTPQPASQQRRAALKKLSRLAAVSAPAVTILLAAQTKPAVAATTSVPIGGSSRQFKTSGEAIDSATVLCGVVGLGPNARDFQAAFGVGDGTTISKIDAVGVCLAAIKALSAKVESLEARAVAA